MRVMPALIPIFPHPIIWLMPMLTHVSTALAEHLLHFSIETALLSGKMADCVHHFTINIELKLIAGLIAHTNGTRIGVAAKMIEHALGRRRFPKHIVENAQSRPGQPCGVQEP